MLILRHLARAGIDDAQTTFEDVVGRHVSELTVFVAEVQRVGADDIVRWELQPDDSWARLGPQDSFEPHAQERLYRWVVERQATTRK